jgi:hypothetical protein
MSVRVTASVDARCSRVIDLAPERWVAPVCGHVEGPPAAPVTLELFGHYAQPECGRAYAAVLQVQSLAPRLRVLYRHAPSPAGTRLCRVAEAAGLQGEFWAAHHDLYRRQREPFELGGLVERLGLAPARFLADVDSELVDELLTRHREVAANFGVRRGPAARVNRIWVTDPTDPRELCRAVRTASRSRR